MHGLMQEWPLLAHTILDHASRMHGKREVISRSVEGPIHRITYADLRTRSLKLSQRLAADGVKLGDRVATMAWNTWRHLESWYGILGVGAIYHTLNPRLFPEQIAWIMNDAEDKMLFVDLTFVKLAEALAPQVPSLKRVVILTDDAHMPETSLPGAVSYESYIAEADGDFEWLRFDENTAAGMCYTSGTTGDPKGVLYSHRSNALHAMMALQPDMMNIGSADRFMPVVPLFHANGWATAFAVPMAGATMVMPGAGMDGKSVYEMLTSERVTITAAVPTVWLMLLQYMEENDCKLPDLHHVIIGGAACPEAVIRKFQNNYGVEVIHAWGMTEMSPIGTVGTLKLADEAKPADERWLLKTSQGRMICMVDMKIVDPMGNRLPHDGKAFGELLVAGPWITSGYYENAEANAAAFDDDGWFRTGDVATIDPDGYMRIVDRAKDVIKSGGEWISSIDLENAVMGHPKVAEAAVIGVTHPKWDERPLLIVVPKPGETPTKDEILSWLSSRVAKLWLPDDMVLVDELPHSGTGKVLKAQLRQTFRDYALPTA